MAWVNSVYSPVSLDSFARRQGIHPLVFHGITATCLDESLGCDHPWHQYPSFKNSRDELARNLAIGSDLVKEWIGYAVAPTWESEVHQIKNNVRTKFRQLDYSCGDSFRLHTKYRKVIAGGQMASEQVALGEPITYTDADEDGICETATVTITPVTGFTDEQEYHVFLPDKEGQLKYRIPHADLDYDDVTETLTITIDFWELVDPSNFSVLRNDLVNACCLGDPINCAECYQDGFLTNVDVYRVYNDTSALQAEIIRPIGGQCKCNRDDECVCETESRPACIEVVDCERGVIRVRPAVFVPNEQCYVADDIGCDFYDYDRIRINYFAGCTEPSCDRNVTSIREACEWLACAVDLLALSKMARICTCTCPLIDINSLKRPVTLITDTSSYIVPENLSQAPFGQLLGQVQAWQMLTLEHSDLTLAAL